MAVGGDLEPETLIAAYRRGIFPWFDHTQPILWWTPEPRAVLRPEAFHQSRSLRKAMRRSHWRLSCDQRFAAVMDACAAPRAQETGTWITPSMREAYLRLHHAGVAHCIEISDPESGLIGGLYGIRLGRVFFGESMFSQQPDASKMALAALIWLAADERLTLIDCQVESDHLLSLGAQLISRREFEFALANDINSQDTRLPDDDNLVESLDKQLGRPLPPFVRDLL